MEGTGGWSEEPRLPVGRYRVRFRGAGARRRIGYLGSAWRGALGHALKQVVCISKVESCPQCLLYHSCVYPYIFETPPPPEAEKMRGYPAAPHPFVLAPGREGPEEEEVALTLFGRANRYLAYVVVALGRVGERGLKRGDCEMGLAGVGQETAAGSGDWREILGEDGVLRPLAVGEAKWPEAPERVRMVLESPLRLREEEEPIGPAELGLGDLLRNLVRRMSLLTYFHCETPLETDFAALSRRARKFKFAQAAFRWQEWSRYSSRQQRKVRMGGVVGEAAVELEGAKEFWPYLWLGQWTYAGKGTSMGLGRYRLEW